MNRLRRLGLASLLSCCILALLGAEDKPGTTSLFPLVTGNTWTYRAGENYFQVKVAEVKNDRAKLDLIVAGKVISSEQVGVAKGALVRYTFENKEANPPIRILELPPKTGASWKVDSKVDGQVLRGTFKAGEEEIKVPAGTYKTVTVAGQDLEANGVRLGLTYYFADKVGMVKQVIEITGQKVIIELEKFEPGK